MTIFEYIDKYGDKTFNEKPINEVDSVLFSFLSYVNLNKINFKDKMTINETAKQFENKYKEKKNIIAERDAVKLLLYIKDKKRYKDCILFNYEYKANNEFQFGVVSIEYLKNKVYISYEGTDELISSWYEDLLLSYVYPTTAQTLAIKYLKKYTFTNKELILGGHSKGGNIALVAGMNSNIVLKRKIRKIYSMDGPGLLPKIFNSKKYQNIENKFVHIVPENSIVGMILENSNNYVVKTNIEGILAHDILYWDITDDYFTITKLSTFSKTFKKNLNNYIYKIDDRDLKKVINNLNKVCNNVGLKTILDVKIGNDTIIKLIKEISHIKDDSRKLALGLLEVLIKSLSKTISLKVQDKIDKVKNGFRIK